MKPFTVRSALFPLLVVVASAADSGTGLPKNSPFQLRGAPAAPVAAANETLEFAGVSSIVGKKPDLIFYDKTAKKSHWIPEGETKEGIAVVRYDATREEAIVKVNGVQKTLALRKPSAPVGGRPAAHTPLPAAAGFNTPAAQPAPIQVPAANASATPATTAGAPAQPVAAAPQGTPAEIQNRQETEARMLVSDLLEIGMAQRRAYEEAQRKAASGNAPAPTPAASEAAQGSPAQPNQPVQ